MDEAVVRPWDPDVELTGPRSVLETDHHNPIKPQSSAASHSSVVNDYGDAEHLAEHRAPSNPRNSRVPRLYTAEIVVHSGAKFTSTSESDVSTQGEPTPIDEIIADVDFTEGVDLGESIRAALQTSAGKEKKDFLPIDALDRIITKPRVRWELRHGNVVPQEQLASFTEQIWEVQKSAKRKTTRRKIFAILALMEKVDKIVDFIREDLHDNDLPFILSNGTRPGLRQLDRKGKDGKLHRIELFAEWSVHELEFFANSAQWQLLSPYFRLNTKDKPRVRHYNLDTGIILPFIEDDEVRHEGGFSDVWRVKISPTHHNYCEDSADPRENPYFAVKRLRHNSYDAFKMEVTALKRFSAKDHLHLIKLLVTFYWREQYYLLFPWADGNLLDFWKLYPHLSDPIRDYELAIWFSRQCLGIVEGLQMIHTLDIPQMDDHLGDASTPQVHGRHGDLKPENILWFKSYEEKNQSCFMGVMKISDFGLTRFHRTMSKSNVDTKGVGMSPTYRAPEYDVAKRVSQSYDIWTLGCVILEFVTWYMLGWAEVDKFSINRKDEDDFELKEHAEDAFFNYVKIKDQNGHFQQLGARAKRSVVDEFNNLCEQENCSEFMLEILDFIENRLLRMGPQKRAGCEEIVKKFEELQRRCMRDKRYCTEPAKKRPPRRSGTDLSVLPASAIDFTPEMDKRIKRNSFIAEHTGPLESDSITAPPKSTSPALVAHSFKDFLFTEPLQRLDETTESQAPKSVRAPTMVGSPRSSMYEPPTSRPQSPLRKVRFEKRKSLQNAEASQARQSDQVKTTHDLDSVDRYESAVSSASLSLPISALRLNIQPPEPSNVSSTDSSPSTAIAQPAPTATEVDASPSNSHNDESNPSRTLNAGDLVGERHPSGNTHNGSLSGTSPKIHVTGVLNGQNTSTTSNDKPSFVESHSQNGDSGNTSEIRKHRGIRKRLLGWFCMKKF